VDIEVICENTSSTPVFFDNLSVKVQAVPTVVLVQENHYYPFGLGMRGLDWVAQGQKEDKYSYNAKEKQTDFDLGWSDYGARQYDPQCGCFRSVDPLAEKYDGLSPYVYALNNPLRFVDPDGRDVIDATDDPLRLIFYGGAKKEGDNSAFQFAAKNVAKDYGSVPSSNIFSIKSAREIVTTINSQKENSIQSVDIFSHGGTNALYSHDSNESFIGNTSLYRSGLKQFFNGAWGEGSAKVGEIDFTKFTNNAKIELHGCNTCDKSSNDDNIASDISTRLYDAGKSKAVVIGHATAANPNINGKKTTNSQQDYRHGTRVIYHNGKVLFSTSNKGRITGSVINKYLEMKEKQGDKYDGNNQVYKK
jgi:RHS repeat-associated protein